MRQIKFYLLFMLLSVMSTQVLSAQNGKFDIEVTTDYSLLDSRKLALDISIKADDVNSEFHAGNFNITITHDGTGILKNAGGGYLPTADGTGGINGSGVYTDGEGTSLYNNPSSAGSSGQRTKYVVSLAGGDGAYVYETGIYLGKLIFDIVDSPIGDPREVNFTIHDNTMFPATVVQEIFGGTTTSADPGNYTFVDDVYDPVAQGKFRLGIYDAKIITDCSMVASDDVLAVEVYMKAHVDDTYFFASELNFRMDHDGVGTLKVAHPDNYMPTAYNGPTTNHPSGGLDGSLYWNETQHNPFPAERSSYEPATTTGSTYNIISYNLELQSGIGTFLTDENWVYVGRILFELEDVRDPGAPNVEDIEFTLYDHSVFPPTFIGEKHSNTLYSAAEGDYIEEDGANCAGVMRMATATFEKGSTNNIKVFPNPSTDVIELELEDYTGLKSLEIYNILGERIMIIDTAEGRKTVDISKLAPSTYIVKSTYDNGDSKSTKFMKI